LSKGDVLQREKREKHPTQHQGPPVTGIEWEREIKQGGGRILARKNMRPPAGRNLLTQETNWATREGSGHQSDSGYPLLQLVLG